MIKTSLVKHIHSATLLRCNSDECLHLQPICVRHCSSLYDLYCHSYKMAVKHPCVECFLWHKRAFWRTSLLLLIMMKSIFFGAPPTLSVASTTAGLRDDVGCIWARAAGSVSPFTAIRAEPRSSPGPSHCAEPLHRSSRRAYSEGKAGLQKRKIPP